MQRICVFCGSSPGSGTEYLTAAKELGRIIAQKKLTLVYGGASVGLMGQVADACLQAGGEVTGVITKKLVEMEVTHKGLTQLFVVESMHERKAKMADLSDGFIALPGGMGTIEEIFEVLTWSQLGIHKKPCGFLNTNRYFNLLLGVLDTAVDQKFIDFAHRHMILVDESPEGLIRKFETYIPPTADKAAWVRHMTEQSKNKGV
jgi:uncharacterized protein (TIGR00730 family)